MFFELLQVALGRRDNLSRIPTPEEWEALYREARRQCVLGLCFEALQRDEGQWGERHAIPLDLKLRWIGKVEKIVDENKKLDQQCKQLCEKFHSSHRLCCILKGQGVARLYPHPEWRQSGDIDVWVPDDRDELVKMTRRVTGKHEQVTYHHTDFRVFADTPVELHFTPSWMCNPLYNRRLQKWFTRNAVRECTWRRLDDNETQSNGFQVPTLEFNIIYILVHILRHVLDEGIGMRQIIDYYFVLKAAEGKIVPKLSLFGLERFAGGLMWMMHEALGLPEEWMIAKPDEKRGRWLLKEVLTAGNFGHDDPRFIDRWHLTRSQRLTSRIRQTIHRCRVAPGEAAWEMPWRIWHYLWRWRKGYL